MLSDGLGDICDSCPNDAENDVDIDSVCRSIDNCPYRPNLAQTDRNGDGTGDACDPDVLDIDRDGVGDVCDSTPGCDGSTCGVSQPEFEQTCFE